MSPAAASEEAPKRLSRSCSGKRTRHPLLKTIFRGASPSKPFGRHRSPPTPATGQEKPHTATKPPQGPFRRLTSPHPPFSRKQSCARRTSGRTTSPTIPLDLSIFRSSWGRRRSWCPGRGGASRKLVLLSSRED